jgi:Uma2 family endonuclease
MAVSPQAKLTETEYLEAERAAETRHEFFDGEMFAMGGASERHNLIVTNLVRELSTRLKGSPCRTYANDMRVKVSSSGLFTYPDVVVVCGEPSFDDEQRDTLLNPQLLVEVLSTSTEAYDRGRKFEHYRTLDSFRDYLLVAQDRPHVEHYQRLEDGRWVMTEALRLEDEIGLGSLGFTLPLAEVYDRVFS